MSITTELGCPQIAHDVLKEEVHIQYDQGEIIFDIEGADRRAEIWARDTALGTDSVARKPLLGTDIAFTHIDIVSGSEGLPEYEWRADVFLGSAYGAATFPDKNVNDIYYLVFLDSKGVLCKRLPGKAPLSPPNTLVVATGYSAIVATKETLQNALETLDKANERIVALETDLGLSEDEYSRCFEATKVLVDRESQKTSALVQCREKRDTAVEITNNLYAGTNGLAKALKRYRKKNKESISSPVRSLVSAVLKQLGKILRAAKAAANESNGQ